SGLGAGLVEHVHGHGVSPLVCIGETYRRGTRRMCRRSGAGRPVEWGVGKARLRSSSYGAAPFASFAMRGFGWPAEPKLAKRAKAGGARRDRTADLLHAMQALSQLSYGPVTILSHDPSGGSRRPARSRYPQACTLITDQG